MTKRGPKEFGIGAVLTCITGRALAPSAQWHECAEWLLGHPVWTHEFALTSTWERLRAAVRRIPAFANVDIDVMCKQAADAVADARLERWVADQGALFGDSFELTWVPTERATGPLSTLQSASRGRG